MPPAAISIVMPVWNGMPYLEEAIESVLLQECSNWRLIISDNGSSDGSRLFLSELGKRGDARIQVFFQDQNLGIFGNLNFLVQKVDSGIIHILCADDRFSNPTCLGEILATWSTGDDRLGAIRWNGSELLKLGVPARIEKPNSQLYFFLFGNIMGNLSCITFAKKAYTAVGPFSEAYPFVGDFDYWSRLAMHAEIEISRSNLLFIRRHMNQASSYLFRNGEMYLEQSEVTAKIYRRITCPTQFSRELLRIAGTLVYDSQFRASMIRAMLRGNPQGLQNLDRAANRGVYIQNSLMRNLLFVFSLGGKIGKMALIKMALKFNLSNGKQHRNPSSPTSG